MPPLPLYQDLTDIPEDDRIKQIGDSAMKGRIIGFFVDDEMGEVRTY